MRLSRSVPIAIVAAVALVPGAVAQAKVVDCSTYADHPNIKISSARGMTCAAAVKVMKSYRGNISPTIHAQGFTCRQVSGSQFGGQWRCAKGARAFRFEFKD
jgi:hypothetical protein